MYSLAVLVAHLPGFQYSAFQPCSCCSECSIRVVLLSNAPNASIRENLYKRVYSICMHHARVRPTSLTSALFGVPESYKAQPACPCRPLDKHSAAATLQHCRRAAMNHQNTLSPPLRSLEYAPYCYCQIHASRVPSDSAYGGLSRNTTNNECLVFILSTDSPLDLLSLFAIDK
jgi:hypothetical protein